MKLFFLSVFACSSLAFNVVPLWGQNEKLPYKAVPYQPFKTQYHQIHPVSKNLQKNAYPHYKYPYPQPVKKIVHPKKYPGAPYPQPVKKVHVKNPNWHPLVQSQPKKLIQARNFNQAPISYEFAFPTPQPYTKFRQKALSKNHRDDVIYEPHLEQIKQQPNDIPTVEREEHEKSPVSYHESPPEIPTRPIYPGEGLWAVPGIKHRPHVTQHQFSPPLQEDVQRPDGYEIFEKQFGNFLRQRNDFDQQLRAFPQNLAYQQNLAQFPSTPPPYPIVRPPKRTYHQKPPQHQEEYYDDHDDKKVVDEFVPSRLYAQVRQTSSTKFLPRKLDEPRLREVVKDSKVATIYQEEGYEDLAYDHAGHEKKAESEQGEENKKDLDDRSRGRFAADEKEDVNMDGSDYVEILKTTPNKKDSKLIKMEQTKTTEIMDRNDGNTQVLSEVFLKQPDNTTSTQKFVSIIPNPTAPNVPEDEEPPVVSIKNKKPVPPENYKESVPPRNEEDYEEEPIQVTLKTNKKPVPPENYKNSVPPESYQKSVTIEKFEIKNQPIASRFYTVKQEPIKSDGDNTQTTEEKPEARLKNETYESNETYHKHESVAQPKTPKNEVVEKIQTYVEINSTPQTFEAVNYNKAPVLPDVYQNKESVVPEVYQNKPTLSVSIKPAFVGEFYNDKNRQNTREQDEGLPKVETTKGYQENADYVDNKEDEPKFYIVTNEPVQNDFLITKRIDSLPDLPNQQQVAQYLEEPAPVQQDEPENPPLQKNAPETYLSSLAHLPYTSKTSLRNLALPTPYNYETTVDTTDVPTDVPTTARYEERTEAEDDTNGVSTTSVPNYEDADYENTTPIPTPLYEESGTVSQNASIFLPTPYSNEDAPRTPKPTESNRPPMLDDQTADEFYGATTESLDEYYSIDPAGQGEISIKFDKIKRTKRAADGSVGGKKIKRQDEDGGHFEAGKIDGGDAENGQNDDDGVEEEETQTESDVLDESDTEPPKLYLETDFVEKLKPIPSYDYPLEGTKYPYYHMPTVNPNSPLRYAQNLQHIPQKHHGNMAFYKQAEKLQCEEVESDVDPVPKRVKEAEEKMPGGDAADLPENPRLSSLGDKIDCFKARYFGEDPFDNPIFKEKIISTPQPIFVGLKTQTKPRKVNKAVLEALEKLYLIKKANRIGGAQKNLILNRANRDALVAPPKNAVSGTPPTYTRETKNELDQTAKIDFRDNPSTTQTTKEETKATPTSPTSSFLVEPNYGVATPETFIEIKKIHTKTTPSTYLRRSKRSSKSEKGSHKDKKRPFVTDEDRSDLHDKNIVNTEDDVDDYYFFDFFEKRPKGDDSLPKIEQEKKKPKKQYKNTKYDNRSDEEAEYEEETSVEESKEKAETTVKNKNVSENSEEDKSEEENKSGEEKAKKEETSSESNNNQEESGEEAESETKEKTKEKAAQRRNDDGSAEEETKSDDEEKENVSRPDEKDYEELINDEFRKFLSFPEDYENYDETKNPDAEAKVKKYFESGESRDESSESKKAATRIDKAFGGRKNTDRKQEDRSNPKKAPKEESEPAESGEEEEEPQAQRREDKASSEVDEESGDETQEKSEQDEIAESAEEEDDDDNEGENKENLKPKNIYDQIKILDDLYGVVNSKPKETREKQEEPKPVSERYLDTMGARNDLDEFRRTNFKVVQYSETQPDDESNESPESRRNNQPVREELIVRYESPVKKKLTQRIKSPTQAESLNRRVSPQPRRYQPRPQQQPRRYQQREFAERSDDEDPPQVVRDGTIIEENSAPPAQPPPVSQPYKQPRRHNYWKFPQKPYPKLEVFDITKFMPKPPYPLFIATPITIIPKYKTISDVAYKASPSEQLNVFTDVIKTIKSSSQETVQAQQASNVEPVVVPPNVQNSPKRRVRYNNTVESVTVRSVKTPTVNRGKQRFTLPENHKYDEEDFSTESSRQSEEQSVEVSVRDIYKTKRKRMPSGEYVSDESDNSQSASEDVVIGLVPPPKDPSKINNFYVAGMKPPAALNNAPVYSDYKLLSNQVKRRVKHKSKRRRSKRSAVKPTYSEISRNNKKPQEQTEEDDYVPHRPKNYHYDVEKKMIVYDGPRNYEFEEEKETTTKRTTTIRATTTKLFPVKEEPDVKTVKEPVNEPSFLEFVLKLKSDKNYQEIPDPKPTEKSEVTITTESTTKGPTVVPEFLSILSKLKSDSNYRFIEDKKSTKATMATTTTGKPAEEEPEEVLKDVQNAPGGAQNGGTATATQDVYLVVDVSETTPKSKNYSPKTVIDTSKYKSIERRPSKKDSPEDVSEVYTEKPHASIKSESSDNIEVVAQISSTTTTEATTTDASQKRRRFRGRNRHRYSTTTTTTETPDGDGSKSAFLVGTTRSPFIRRHQRTSTEKFLDEAAADSPQKSLFRRHQQQRPPNHKETFTPVEERTTKTPAKNQPRPERRKNKEVDVFQKYDTSKKHGGNYKKVEDQHQQSANDEERLTDIVPKPYSFYSDPKLPKYINLLKEPNTPSNHEEIEEEVLDRQKISKRIDTLEEEPNEKRSEKRKLSEDDDDEQDDDDIKEKTTKKPFFIKDPSKRFYYYAPV